MNFQDFENKPDDFHMFDDKKDIGQIENSDDEEFKLD